MVRSAQPLALGWAFGRVVHQPMRQALYRVRHQAVSQAVCQAVAQVCALVATVVEETVRASTGMHVTTEVADSVPGQVAYPVGQKVVDEVARTAEAEIGAQRDADAHRRVTPDVRARSVHTAFADISIDARTAVPAVICSTTQIGAPRWVAHHG